MMITTSHVRKTALNNHRIKKAKHLIAKKIERYSYLFFCENHSTSEYFALFTFFAYEFEYAVAFNRPLQSVLLGIRVRILYDYYDIYYLVPFWFSSFVWEKRSAIALHFLLFSSLLRYEKLETNKRSWTEFRKMRNHKNSNTFALWKRQLHTNAKY